MATWKKVLLEGGVTGTAPIDVTNEDVSLDLKTNGGLVVESNELAVDLAASSITGTLAVGDGGTGLTTAAKGSVLVANTLNTISALDGGGSGQDGYILTYDGTNDTISWAANAADANQNAFSAVTVDTGVGPDAESAQDDLTLAGEANVITTTGSATNVVTISIDDAGIDTDKLADSAVTTAKIADSNVTLAKMANLAAMKVIGNTSGTAATPAAVSILDEDDMTSNSDTSLATQQSIKAYVDTQVAAGYDLDVSADSGNAEKILNTETLNLAGTASQISTTTGTNSVTFSIPNAFTAPGSIASTTTITSGTGLTVTSGGATITAGGLDVNGGAVTLGTDGTTVEGGGLTVSGGGAAITGDTTVTGNLTVTGTTTTLQTENVLIEDKFLVLGNPDSSYADDAAAVTGATGGGISVLSDTDGSEGSYAAVMWNNNYLTGWEVGDAASVSEDGNKHPIAIMDFVVNSAAAPTVDSAGVGSFFFAQANANTDGALYVRVQ